MNCWWEKTRKTSSCHLGRCSLAFRRFFSRFSGRGSVPERHLLGLQVGLLHGAGAAGCAGPAPTGIHWAGDTGARLEPGRGESRKSGLGLGIGRRFLVVLDHRLCLSLLSFACRVCFGSEGHWMISPPGHPLLRKKKRERVLQRSVWVFSVCLRSSFEQPSEKDTSPTPRQDCSSWCSDFQAYGQNWSSPQVVVHVTHLMGPEGLASIYKAQ